jgi:hypothetical protein
VERVHPDPFAAEECPLREVDVPAASAGPSDHLSGTDVLTVIDRGIDMPVDEVPYADTAMPARTGVRRRRVAYARVPGVDCIDAMAAAGRRIRLRVQIVDGYVYADVIATWARGEKRAADRVLAVERRDWPASESRLVCVSEADR